MAITWVDLTRLKFSLAVCGVALAATPVSAVAQEATETPQAESAVAPSEEPATAAPPADTTSAGETLEGAVSAPDIAASTAAAQTAAAEAPTVQSGGFVQRLSDRLNGINPTRPLPVPPENRDPRADLLDTSFPAEQPEVVDRGTFEGAPNSRPTQVRTANGITELSNRAEELPDERVPSLNRAVTPKPPISRPQVNTAMDAPRLDAHVSVPTTSSTRNGSSMSPWLWILAGTAALLLVPIAFLLTRPTR